MKKALSIFLMLILLSASLIASGYAFFNFSDIHQIDNIDTTFGNTKFREINNDYYKIYFFASPYYATGADGITSDNPLDIANSDNNPYNDEEEYLVGQKSSLGEKEKQYANIFFPNGTNFYYAAKSIDQETLNGPNGDGKSVVKRFQKRDFTGYIRKNTQLGITDKEYKYISITVKGNISSSTLSSIISTSEFKDRLGFGPEFVGWTYNKEAVKKRTMYGDDRYQIDNSFSVKDDRGWNDSSQTPYLIGNYGCQGEIEQISSNTSLYYIDNLVASTTSTASDTSTAKTSIDGSLVGDHVIYLYPVFEAKNYSTDKSLGGVTTAYLKFRVNADTDENSDTYYMYKQSGEIDYSKNRYTVGLFQNDISEQTEATDVDTTLKINYYTDNMYIDTSGDNQIKSMQLDVSPANLTSTSDWAQKWTTMLSYEDIKALNLEAGYYNVDIHFVQDNTLNETTATQKVIEFMQKFENSNRYVAIYGSRRSSDPTQYGLHSMRMNDSDANFTTRTYYVIGFQKVDEYHITGDNLNGSINDYNAPGYKKIFTAEVGNDYEQFYTIDRIYLQQNDEIAILSEDYSSLADVDYGISSLSDTEIERFNTSLTNSSHTSKNPFSSLGSEAIIVDSTTHEESKGDVLLKALTENGTTKKIKALEAGNYSLIFTFSYKDGKVIDINVGYRRNEEEFTFVVLDTKPSDITFTDYNSLIGTEPFFAAREASIYTTLSITDPLYFHKLTTKTGTFATLFDYCSENNKKIVDTATGLEVTRDLFENQKFILNRSYVVYLADK